MTLEQFQSGYARAALAGAFAHMRQRAKTAATLRAQGRRGPITGAMLDRVAGSAEPIPGTRAWIAQRAREFDNRARK